MTSRWIDLPDDLPTMMAGAMQLGLLWLTEVGMDADGTTMVRYTDVLGQRMATYI